MTKYYDATKECAPFVRPELAQRAPERRKRSKKTPQKTA